MSGKLKLIFFLILVIFPFGQVLRWQVPFWPEVRLQPLDFLTFAFVIFWLGEKLIKKEKFTAPAFFREMAIFGGVASFSLLVRIPFLPLKELLPASFYLLRLWNFLFFYWALTDFFRREKPALSKYLIWEGGVIALFSLGQYLLLPDTRFLLYLGWDEHFFRAIGSFLDPAFTGLLLVLAFLVWTIELLKQKKANFWFWTAGILIFLCLGLSFSRLSYLLLAVGLGIILFFEKRLKLYFLFGFLFIGLLFFLPKPGGEGVNLLRTSSFSSRLENYQETWQIIQKNWVLGVGFNTYRYAQREAGFLQPGRWLTTELWQKSNAAAGADNSFLFVWATCGIFGLLAYIWWWLKIIRESLVARKRSEGFLVFASVMVLVISGFFINSLFYPWVLCWLMLLLAQFKAQS